MLLLVAGDTREGDDGESTGPGESIEVTALTVVSVPPAVAEPMPDDLEAIAHDHAGPESAPERRAIISTPSAGMGELRSSGSPSPTLIKRIGRLRALGAQDRNPRETSGFPTMRVVAPSITPTTPDARPYRATGAPRSADDGIRSLTGRSPFREQQQQQQQQVQAPGHGSPGQLAARGEESPDQVRLRQHAVRSR